ncbi:GTPase [Klebsiella pneumoniae]|uniref:GTPase n=1 Tax=Klebsiella pneumoniae TaxID=573 RepID=A0A378F996_KLEPN|nr:GTPase [Klebsiella pneumoniae]
MTLDYVALAILIAVALILFYGVIVIHDIPYEIAKSGVILIRMRFIMPVGSAYLPSTRCGPLLWIWATLWREDRGWGMRHIADEQQALHQRLETVVQQLEQVQREVDVLKAKEAK